MRGLATSKALTRILLSLSAVGSSSDAAALAVGESHQPCPRSNATHIVWKTCCQDDVTTIHTIRRSQERIVTSPASYDQCGGCLIQLRSDAEKDCLQYLRDNVMPFDEPFLETMGFPTMDDDTADGLNDGMVGPTVTLALDAKILYPWTDDLPKDIFLNYVLNYANLNEARTNWRPLLVDVMKFNETDLYKSGNANLTSAVTWCNTNLWTLLARDPNHPIYFKSSQTPLIFDPMSTIAFGYASCTGTSILFSNALRALGIPARVAGTPAWFGNKTRGNHNWVEVYVGNGEWKFLEPSPALSHVDNLEASPCSRWFCDKSRYPASKVYAALMTRDPEYKEQDPATHFPLAWEWDSEDVPAVDRTGYYADVCGGCDKE